MLKLRMNHITFNEKNETLCSIRKGVHTQRRLMNLFFDSLPNELQAYIYTYDNTYRTKFNDVIRQLEYKHDLAASCGYQFPKHTLDGLLQRLYRSLNRNNRCICYFCRSCCCDD